MKKNLCFILLSATLMAVSLVSCNRKENQPEPKAVNVTINSNAPEVPADQAVRSSIQPKEGGFESLWNKGDVLGVWADNISDSPASFTNQNETGAKGSFTGTIQVTEGTHTIYACSPSSAFSGTVSGTSVFLTLPANQSATLKSYDAKADILVAKPEQIEVSSSTVNVDNMKFARIGTVLQIIPADKTTGSVLAADKVSTVKITAEGASLAGKLTVDLSNGEVSGIGDASSSVTVSYSGDEFVGIDGENSIFAVINPSTVPSSGKLTFNIATDKHSITKEVTGKEIKFPAGRIAVINLTIEDGNVKGEDSHEIGFEFYKEDFNWIGTVWSPSYPKYGMPGVRSNAAGDKWNEYVVTGYTNTQAKFDEKGLGYNDNTYVHYEGYIKLSKAAAAGFIKTPAIGGVDAGTTCNVSVSWDAATYLNPGGDSPTETNAYQTVTVSGAGKIVSCGTTGATIASDGLSATIPVIRDENHLFFMYTKQIIVEGADATTQIQFGEDGTSGDFRSYVDNISVKKVAKGTTAAADALVAKPQTVDCEATEQAAADGAGEDITLTLRMDRAWTLVSNNDWITIKSIMAGTTATAVKIADDYKSATETGTGLMYLNAIVTVAKNETGAQRSGTLSFKDTATGNVCKTITITQEARQGTTTCVAKWTMTSVYKEASYTNKDIIYKSEAYEKIGKLWIVDNTNVPSDVVTGGEISVVNGSGKKLTRSTAPATHCWNRIRLTGVDNGDGWCFKATGITAAIGDKIEFKNAYLGCANAGDIPATWEMQYSYNGNDWVKLSDVTKPEAADKSISLDASVELTQEIENGAFYFRLVATSDAPKQSNSIPFILVYPNMDSKSYATRTKLYTEETDYITINVINY